MKTKMKNYYLPIHCLVLLLALVVSVHAQQSNPSDTADGADADNKTAQAPKPESTSIRDNFKYIFEVGGQIRSLSGERPTKFEEFGRIREGLILRRFRVSSNPPTSPNFLRFIGKGSTEIDRQFFLDAGRYGKFRTTLEWSTTPHLFSDGAKSFFTGGNGVITIADTIQTTLQNTPDVALPAEVRNQLATASTIRLQTKRETIDFNQTVNLNKHWSFRFNWLRNMRTGNRPLGMGTYERVGTSTGDTFRVLSTELPEPLDYTSDRITLGTSYVRKNWGVNFDYIYSVFDNAIPTLTFDNPFRITDLQATGTGGVFNRGAFVRGIYALEPGNEAHSILISAFVDLPLRTRIAGALGWSRFTQDEQFAPYTLNSAIVTGVPAGLNITSTASLPQQSLNGQVDVLSEDFLVTSRYWKNLNFNVHFRRYEYDNKSDEILFAGYAAYSDSYWRTNIAGVLIENEPPSYFRTNVSAEAVWDISKQFRWKAEYEWEGWVRRHRQVGRSNEHSIASQLSFKPTARFSGKLNYKYSDRTPNRYNPGVKEFNQLRMFDQAKRLRHDVDWQWQLAITPQVGLSGTIGYLSDDYDQNFFGLVRATQWYGTADMLYMPKDNITVYFNYSRENYNSSMRNISKTAAPYALENRWDRDEKDVLDNFGIGATTYLMKEKMLLDLHYVFANGKTRTLTSNPATPLANSVLNATAFPFPDVKTRFQEFNLDTNYQFKNNVAVGIRYIYQPYSLDDFALNGLTPYPQTALTAEQDGRRFLLLDSRFSSHQAHVFSLYFRFGN